MQGNNFLLKKQIFAELFPTIILSSPISRIELLSSAASLIMDRRLSFYLEMINLY